MNNLANETKLPLATFFTKENLYLSPGREIWLSYAPTNDFVARFKYGTRSKANRFVKFLIANFTVEEYFNELKVKHIAPLQILINKGYDPFSKAQKAALAEIHSKYPKIN